MQRLTAKEQCEHIENRPAVLKERHRVPLKEITQQLLLTETAKLKNKKAHQCAKLFPKILHKANTQLLFTYSLARVSKHTEVNIKLAGHTSVLVAQQSTQSAAIPTLCSQVACAPFVQCHFAPIPHSEPGCSSSTSQVCWGFSIVLQFW